jgi:hypothetical protein
MARSASQQPARTRPVATPPATWTDRTASLARRLSEKPMAFSRMPRRITGRPLSDRSSSAMISAMWRRNHGRTCDGVDVLHREAFAEGLADREQASGAARESAALISSRSAFQRDHAVEAVSPVSSPRSAFCSDSWKLRPIAITSPTDFIAVVSSGSAPLNFSKAKRGILVTT